MKYTRHWKAGTLVLDMAKMLIPILHFCYILGTVPFLDSKNVKMIIAVR